jgi:hypothetical protein
VRKLIAGMKISVDGKMEGPEGMADWVDAWSEDYGLTPQIDGCLLGAGMYPGYERLLDRDPDGAANARLDHRQAADAGGNRMGPLRPADPALRAVEHAHVGSLANDTFRPGPR